MEHFATMVYSQKPLTFVAKLSIVCRSPEYSSALYFQKTWSSKISTSKEFSMIKNVFQNQVFFHDQGSFPQAEIFYLSRKFSTMRRLFHKQRFFLDQESFLQGKTFPLSRRFFTSKDFFLIRELFYKKRFLHPYNA